MYEYSLIFRFEIVIDVGLSFWLADWDWFRWVNIPKFDLGMWFLFHVTKITIMLIHLGVFWIRLSNFWLSSFLYVWKTYVFSHAVTFGSLLSDVVLVCSSNSNFLVVFLCLRMKNPYIFTCSKFWLSFNRDVFELQNSSWLSPFWVYDFILLYHCKCSSWWSSKNIRLRLRLCGVRIFIL